MLIQLNFAAHLSMVLPIVAYGDPVLKKRGADIEEITPEIKELIANMFETMNNASGVGLAAPQVGESKRLFIVDASPFADDDELEEDEKARLLKFKKVFINPTIYEEDGEEWAFEEGCLSIPDIREDVTRKPLIRIRYRNEEFEEVDEEVDGLAARVIQHEYDHIEGILFTDHLNPFKKRRLKKKLMAIAKGAVDVKYKMKFPLAKRGR